MNISKIQPYLNFKANYIDSSAVLRVNQQSKIWYNQDVTIVELDPNNFDDLNVLADANAIWRGNIHEMCFANDIYADALSKRNNHNIKPEFESSFLAITTQKDRFEKIKLSNVLGLSEILTNYTTGNHDIAYLQVSPEHTFNSPHREYKKIGYKFMQKIMEFFKGNIELVSTDEAINFYKLLGFVEKNTLSHAQLIYRHK